MREVDAGEREMWVGTQSASAGYKQTKRAEGNLF